MEKRSSQYQSLFLDRLREVYDPKINETPVRRVPKLDPMNDLRMRIANPSLLETYLRLIERRTHVNIKSVS